MALNEPTTERQVMSEKEYSKQELEDMFDECYDEAVRRVAAFKTHFEKKGLEITEEMCKERFLKIIERRMEDKQGITLARFKEHAENHFLKRFSDDIDNRRNERNINPDRDSGFSR